MSGSLGPDNEVNTKEFIFQYRYYKDNISLVKDNDALDSRPRIGYVGKERKA